MSPIVAFRILSDGMVNGTLQQRSSIDSTKVQYYQHCRNVIFRPVMILIIYNNMNVCMVITYSKSKNQPSKVVNPARGQLNRKNVFFPVPVRG